VPTFGNFEKSTDRDTKMDTKFLILSFLLQVRSETHRGGILYPRESESRQVVSLDGLWNFVVPAANNPLQGFDEHWYKKYLKEVHFRYFLSFFFGKMSCS
jgi:hypothetical protein